MKLKTIALAALATATLATASAADNSYFSFQRNLDAQSTLDLGVVASAGAGVVEIYDFRRGEVGSLLGATSVNAGANHDVRVTVGEQPRADVIAILTVNGQEVASREYIIEQ